MIDTKYNYIAQDENGEIWMFAAKPWLKKSIFSSEKNVWVINGTGTKKCDMKLDLGDDYRESLHSISVVGSMINITKVKDNGIPVDTKYNYIAQDENGEIWMFAAKPKLSPIGWDSLGDAEEYKGKLDLGDDYRESLRLIYKGELKKVKDNDMNILDQKRFVESRCHLTEIRATPEQVKKIYNLISFLDQEGLLLSFTKSHILINDKKDGLKTIAQAFIL